MRQEIAKIQKVIDELETYFFHTCRANSITVKIVRQKNLFTVQMTIQDVHLAPAACLALEKKFDRPRSPELENYYWQLTGENEESSELNLVAMMCDSISMNYQEPVLTLELKRNF